MYALIVKSNSGNTYVYGTFPTKELATQFFHAEGIEGGTAEWQIVTFLPSCI
jgi:hypothetical protein